MKHIARWVYDSCLSGISLDLRMGPASCVRFGLLALLSLT